MASQALDLQAEAARSLFEIARDFVSKRVARFGGHRLSESVDTTPISVEPSSVSNPPRTWPVPPGVGLTHRPQDFFVAAPGRTAPRNEPDRSNQISGLLVEMRMQHVG